MSESTYKTIESCYFHWGNGGLSFRVVEHTHKWTSHRDDPGEIRMDHETREHVSVTYRMEVDASHHGGVMTTSFDLGSMEIVGWLHEMTGRLLKRMSSQPEQGRHHVFEYHPQGKVSIEDGEPKEYHFRFRDGKVTPVVMEQRSFSGPGFAGTTYAEKNES